MREVDDLKELKRAYLGQLVRRHGEEVTEFGAFKQSLLDLNRRHRLEAVRAYLGAISRVGKKTGRKTGGSGRTAG